MASSQVDAQLKHLSFVKILAINAVVLMANLYDYTKHNSGPLKSTFGKVEKAVSAAVSPVYDRFKGVPTDILVFLDNKLDEVSQKIDDLAPPAAKKAAFNAQYIVKTISHVAYNLIEEAKAAGPFAAASHAGSIFKDFAVTQLAVVWYKANHYPALHGVTEVAATTVSHWSEKYNQLVRDMNAKGCSLFSYVPLVPVEEMAKAYKQVEAAIGKKVDTTGCSSDSELDKE